MRWNWFFAGRKAFSRSFSRSQRGWWAGVIEVLFALTLLMAGVVLIVVNLTNAVLFSTPADFFKPFWIFVLQLCLGGIMIVVGSLRIVATLWKVAGSAERRGALVSRANEIELLNEVRRRREDLPTVPALPNQPVRGVSQKFRLVGSRRNRWGFGISLALVLVLASVSTIVAITAISTVDSNEVDWLAFCMLAFLIPATVWSMQTFVRQMLKLTGLGPTQLEIGNHPLYPGQKVQLSLRQPGRLRLQLLQVTLKCEEEATFDQGTNIRTERKTVYDQRLFRKRGITIKPDQPYHDEFELLLPEGAMHSFKSANNRVQWKIVVHALAKGWPEFEREFVISVHPSIANQNQAA